MHLKTRNVNTGFQDLTGLFAREGRYTGRGGLPTRGLYDDIPVVRRQSRNGPVLAVDEPVTVTFSHPRERVLLNAARDANPFLHLYEALYHLAGRNDVAPLAYYAKQMREYSDDGETLNGSYGHRWRKALVWDGDAPGVTPFPYADDGGTVDQLDILVSHLKADPDSRRAVLQMWNVQDDLLKIGSNVTHQPVIDWEVASKDVCCLAGDTKFRSPEGDKNIKSLAEKFHTEPGYRYPVYTIDPITGDQRLSWMTAAWRTGVKKTLVLRLDDGSSLHLTANHVVYRKKKTFDGKRRTGIAVSECEAGDLRVGDSLLSELPEGSACRVNQGYRHFKRNVFKNTGGRNMAKEHREYYEFVTGERLVGNDIHHVNENRLDNRLENLESLTEAEHQRLHKSGGNNPHSKMSPEDRARRGKIHSAVLRSGGRQNTPDHVRAVLSVRPPLRTDEQNEILWDWVCSLSNHKVVAIEDGGYKTVYDFTVPGRHNAVLSNGVLVHNCNLCVKFRLREDGYERPDGYGDFVRVDRKVLDATVFNRSNDLVWGMLGANHVTFTVLQEYVAARLGAGVGRYNVVTDDLHAYQGGAGTAKWEPEKWLADGAADCYRSTATRTVPLVRDSAAFEAELPAVVSLFDGSRHGRRDAFPLPSEPFLAGVACPVFSAFAAHKGGRTPDALTIVDRVEADDWRTAARGWLERRKK